MCVLDGSHSTCDCNPLSSDIHTHRSAILSSLFLTFLLLNAHDLYYEKGKKTINQQTKPVCGIKGVGGDHLNVEELTSYIAFCT